MRILGDFRTADLRKLLNSYKGAVAAVRFVLQTGLMAQFSLVTKSEQAEQAERLRVAGPPPGCRPSTDIGGLEGNESGEFRDESEADNSQSDSEDAVASHADRISFSGNESS
jgi:hypothetical protein